ncbi:arylsulfatase A-like enzyme [Mariniflexile fucanivorans]|uniref:Arylsulfatase A-like enzyme n=1 Tax=Mariniflexile fucanivorans TaxID=264023 RepID=A0A4R1RMF9_9FLAO|nr:arylsulfatase [Mariniflexile fucanivorans]TCL67461.1 arylsulfatase A-like enzyme [Mariniflexile fucanivorans]
MKSNYLKILVFLLVCNSLQAQEQVKPNIIYILADDLGIGDLTIYNENGKIPTPHLDQMGREGLKFNDAHTSSSVCTPTRYGILTGRYNWRTPLKEFVLWGSSPTLIKEGRLTVAKMLKDKGYNTASIGKWHLGLNWSMKDGAKEFDYYADREDRLDISKIDYSKKLKFGPNNLGFDYSYTLAASLNMPPFVYLENDKPSMLPTSISERKRGENEYSTWIKGAISDDFVHEQVLPDFVNKTISYIKDNAKSDKPFFIYLPLPAPHNPVLPIAPWDGKSGINPYADFVMMIDDLMGDIFKTLKEQGIEENTLVVFTSDNGCATTVNLPLLKKAGHSPSYIYNGFKGSYLEGGHRVPFLVKWPKMIKPNSVSDATICTTDFMATCADLVNYNLKDNEAEDSFSMLPLLLQNGKYEREATIHHSKEGVFAIRKGDWKLIASPNSGVNAAGEPGKSRSKDDHDILYNLKTDIAEKDDVATKYPEKVKELKQLLIKQINDGRTTKGENQPNDPISSYWPQAEFALNKNN